MLKKAKIRNWGGGQGYSEVVYAVIGSMCVFSGITPQHAPHGRTSTINAAEEFIEVICRQEGNGPTDLNFHDLQTCVGYSGRHFQEGRFAFDRIRFKVAEGKITDIGWVPVECPRRVIELFRECLGPDPVQWAGGGRFEDLGKAETAHLN